MARILMEPMELGNQMIAFVEQSMYVGSQKEWVEILPRSDGSRHYTAVRDVSLANDLYLAYLSKNVEVGLDKYIGKHLASRNKEKK